jgi:hypothetical protein
VEVRLKSISADSIPEALAKVETYRYLNEPEEAESICRDILAIDPENQMALRLLGLAITDQFTGGAGDRCGEAEGIFRNLRDPYERLYYTGLVRERWAKAQLSAGRPPHTLLALFEGAMQCFAQAEQIRPAGNDDAILRWNRCVRLLESRLGPEWRHQEVEHFDLHDSPPV